MELIKIALVANVGITNEPILEALEIAKEEGDLTLFLVYGRQIADQETMPLSVGSSISTRARELDINCKVYELDSPEDFDRSFKFYQQLLNEVAYYGSERIILDVTGGTKVMSAAMVHAALAREWDAEVIFEYVGGPRNANGRVREMAVKRDSGIVTQERMTNVIDSMRLQQFSRAKVLSESLPKYGKAAFIKICAQLFWLWDNFHYEEGAQKIEDTKKQAKVLVDDRQLQKIAETVLRLSKFSPRIMLTTNSLNKLKESDDNSLNKEKLQGWLNILGDTIANARRRINSEPVDCVLRCYRAIEIAAQIVVFTLGVNIWNPKWETLDKEQLEAYLLKIRVKEPPKQLSLDMNIKLIETLKSPLPQEVDADIKNIMSARNFSYLEHGYDNISVSTAQSLMLKTEKIITNLVSKTKLKYDPLEIADQLRIEA